MSNLDPIVIARYLVNDPQFLDSVASRADIKGDKGDRGEDGKDGARGPKGEKGERGPRGNMGPQGPIGLTGPKGKDGKDGRNGKDGKDGKDGATVEEVWNMFEKEVDLSDLIKEEIGKLPAGIGGGAGRLDVQDLPGYRGATAGQVFGILSSGKAGFIDQAGGGVSDHGALSGLADDDHTQYHNDTRGDARYYTQALLDAGQLDTRYYTESEVDTLLAGYYTTSEVDTLLAAQDAISELTDVTITAIASGEILKWDGAGWINNTLAEAGISAVGHTHTTSDITDLSSYTGFDARYYTETEVDTLLSGYLQNIVEDTTPQLGGDLDAGANDILFDNGYGFVSDAGGTLKTGPGGVSWYAQAGSNVGLGFAVKDFAGSDLLQFVYSTTGTDLITNFLQDDGLTILLQLDHVNNLLTVGGDLDMQSNDILFDNGYGFQSDAGGLLKTGAGGATWQFTPGNNSAAGLVVNSTTATVLAAIVFGDGAGNWETQFREDDGLTSLLNINHSTGKIYTGGSDLYGAEVGSLTISTGNSGVTSVDTTGDDLIIENDTNAGISIITPNTAQAEINFGDPQDTNIGRIMYDHSTNAMDFRVNAGTPLRIDSTNRIILGAVGADALGAEAGATTISTGDSGVTSINGAADNLIIEDDVNAGITIASPNTGSCSIYFADPEGNQSGAVIYNHSTNTLSLRANSSSNLHFDGSSLLLENSGTDVIQIFNTNSASSGPDIQIYSAGVIACEGSLTVAIDSDNNATGASFAVVHDADNNTGAELFRVDEDGTATAQGSVVAPNVGFFIVGEENATIAGTGYLFSYGNGATNQYGPVVPFACTVTHLSIGTIDNSTASFTMQLVKNGTPVTGATVTLSGAASGVQALGTPVSFAAGDRLSFYISAFTSATAGALASAFIKAS